MRWLALLIALLTPALGWAHRPRAPQEVWVLNYHNLTSTSKAALSDTYANSVGHFARELNWLHDNGYHPISVNELIDAKEGKSALPQKPVLLTFDDGLQSFYTRAFPLLVAFHYPAVLAVVARWLKPPPGATEIYGDTEKVSRNFFITRREARFMERSGLVEFADHTYSSHHSILANPYGGMQPAVITHAYYAKTHRYETDAHYLRRMRLDMLKDANFIQRYVGTRPRIMVWPYGRYNKAVVDLAAEDGLPIVFTLNDGPYKLSMSLSAIPRTLVDGNMTLAQFANIFKPHHYKTVYRTLSVGLNALYSPNPKIQTERFNVMLNQLKALQATDVFMSAFTANGKKAFFPSQQLPVQSGLFGRVAWQIATRSGAEVYARVPTLSSLHAKHRLNLSELLENISRYAILNGFLFMDSRHPCDARHAYERDRAIIRKAAYWESRTHIACALPMTRLLWDVQHSPEAVRELMHFQLLVATGVPTHVALSTEPNLAAGFRALQVHRTLRNKTIFQLEASTDSARGIARARATLRTLHLGDVLNFGVVANELPVAPKRLAKIWSEFSLKNVITHRQ